VTVLKYSDRLAAHPQVVLHEEFKDCAVMYHPLINETFATGAVGVAIWKALDGRRSLAEIAALIKAEYEDAPDSLLEDTLAFSQELYRRLFVVLAPEGDKR
jgi:hypothetical protein